MKNCMLKNANYCQYTFSYRVEDWTKSGPEAVSPSSLHLDEDGEKGICPTVVQIDFFGLIIVRICFFILFYNIMRLFRDH